MKTICITGPESTGKSTLAAELALHYGCEWVPEFARNFLTVRPGPYTQKDLLTIARGQTNWVKEKRNSLLVPASHRFLFIDTDISVIKIWSAEKFGSVDKEILQLAREECYDLYLLCAPDIPWQPDVLRENAHDRDQLFRLYKNELVAMGKKFFVIEGNGADRLQCAVSVLDGLK